MGTRAKGLLGVLGIWIGNGIAVPLINVHREAFNEHQLIVVRGLMMCAVGFAMVRGTLQRPTRHVVTFCVIFAFACFGLYKGVRTWGASPTIIVLTLTPIVNFVISALTGRKLTGAMLLTALTMFVGVTFALEPWSSWHEMSVAGLGWSVFATVLSGLGYEAFKKSSVVPGWVRVFWLGVAFLVFGVIGSADVSWTNLTDTGLFLYLLAFGLLAGPIYVISNTLAFDNMRVETASILAQGETPAIMLFSALILGEPLTIAKVVGTIIAFVGAWYLSRTIT